MSEKIYLDYTRDELDDQYINVKTDADEATRIRLVTHSAAVADRLATARDLSYSEHPKDRFDFYHAEGGPAPVIIFAHGGQWQRGSTTASSGWAEAALSHGISFVAGTFPMLAEVRIPDMVDHVTALVRHVRAHAAELHPQVGGLHLREPDVDELDAVAARGIGGDARLAHARRAP